MLIRLNKFLADSGICSRRSADKLIKSGNVSVGKKVVKELGDRIDPEKDEVFVNGKLVEKKGNKVYYILNKPIGYVTTLRDPQGRKTIASLVPSIPRVYPVGRLDYDSSGLIILTNDGDFAYKMSHPKFEKAKEYLVFAKTKSPIFNPQFLAKGSLRDIFKKGVKLKEGIAKADEIKVISQKGSKIEFSIIIHQGWNRQIRRMCEAIGLEVVSLKRVRIGNIKLGGLKEGEWKKISIENI